MGLTRVQRPLLFIALLAVASVAGFWWWGQQPTETVTEQLVLYGNVDIRQADLAFNGTERIASMLVQEGDSVSAGQLLATLRPDRIAAAVARAEAELAAQQQVVARLEAGTRIEDINRVRAELELAEATAVDASRSFQRIQNLAAQRLASQQQVDDAKAAADSATAKVKAAQAALALALAGPRQEDIAAARATLKALDSQLALAHVQLKDASLHAPSDGVIRNRIMEPGEMASPQRPVFTLALTNPVWVRAYLDGPDLGKVFPGMAAIVNTDSFPGKDYPGWIGFISPTAEFTPKSVQTQEVRASLVYQVRVYACNSENELRLGMPATVTIDLSQPRAQNGNPTGHCASRNAQ